VGNGPAQSQSWVLSDYLAQHHELSTVMKLGIYHPRKKTRKKTLRFHCFFFDFVLETDTLLSIDRWHEYR